MLNNQKMLRLFELRGRVRMADVIGQGARVGRGFADVGYEEFMVLPGEKILSLLTGAVTALDQVRREHLFEILSADQLIAEIHQVGYQILSLECRDRRLWSGSVEGVDGQGVCLAESASLEECLLRLVLGIYQVNCPLEERCLKSVMVNG